MIWQDVLFAVGGFIFSIALIPTVIGKDKPALSTSLMTGIVLTAYLLAFISLGLQLAFISGGITAIMWFILAIQKMVQK